MEQAVLELEEALKLAEAEAENFVEEPTPKATKKKKK
jgi:hypothetical protein